jgi:archaellum component FlaG (FlaF/FlaG flagellin family)
MVGKTPVVVVAVVAVAAAAAILGYALLSPNNQPAQATTASAVGAASTSQGALQITSASLSGGTMTLTVKNTGSQTASIDALMLLDGTGCPQSTFASTTAQTSQNRSQFTRLACMEGSTNFLVQSNGTVRQLATPQFNSTSRSQSSFTRTLNSSRSGGFQGPGGLFGGSGYQLAAGQSVTLTFTGATGTQVTSGSQYTIDVVGQQARAQITLTAT